MDGGKRAIMFNRFPNPFTGEASGIQRTVYPTEREFFMDNLLVRIHLIMEMILVDRPCAMGV